MAGQARYELLLIKQMAKASVKARAAKTPKFSTRIVRRCFRCGRKRGYMRDFDLCRICFREYANEGQIPGVKKSSW
jgi:small subunit ribosomal protein S14